MINADTKQFEKAQLCENLAKALNGGDEEAMAKAFAEFAESIQLKLIQEAATLEETTDKTVLASRGLRQLTGKETKFYNGLIKSMKSAAVQKGFAGLDTDGVLPETVIDTIFDDLRRNHPLLSAINFTNTSTVTKFVVNKQGVQIAQWGPLNSEITKELEGAIGLEDISLNKLTAFMPVSLDMLDLGPVWIDRYIREVLSEAIAEGLELAIVDGTGNNQPIGMTRSVAKDVTVIGNTYPQKTAIPVTELTPVVYGDLVSRLAKAPNDKTRVVSSVMLVVNPVDYLQKVMPCTTLQTTDGTYKTDVFPFPTRVVQSPHVPSGKAVIGLGSRYFMGLGVGGSGGKIEYSDEYKFLEEVRTYKTKMYGNGKPLDDNAFLLLDISGLKPTNLKVTVEEVKGTVKTKEQA